MSTRRFPRNPIPETVRASIPRRETPEQLTQCAEEWGGVQPAPVRPDDPAPERTERGLAVWGRTTCTYGTEVTVQDSSAAEYPRIWLRLTQDSDVLHDGSVGEAAAHLSPGQARQVADALSSAIYEAHGTWGADLDDDED